MSSSCRADKLNPNQGTRDSLLSGARRSDPDSWTRLCRLYEPLVSYWCFRQGVPRQEIADVVQDVFSSVARSLHTFQKRKQGDSFRAWLKTVTRNRAMDWFRDNGGKAMASGGSVAWKRMTELPFETSFVDANESCCEEADLHRRVLDEALQSVQTGCDEHTWQAFWRVVVDGARPVDVAEELGLPAVSVRVAKCRVLNRLRRELGERGA